MKRNDYFLGVLLLLFMFLDVSLFKRIHFSLTLSLIVVLLLRSKLTNYLAFGFLILFDLIFSSFLGEVSAPVIVATFFIVIVASRIRIPTVIQISFVYLIVLFTLLLASRNFKASLEFSSYSTLFSFLFLPFIKERVYEKEKS